MENTELTNAPFLGCREILKTGKNRGKRCGSWKIYCGNRCLRHHQMATRNGLSNNLNSDYGNPEQAHLWVQWVNNV